MGRASLLQLLRERINTQSTSPTEDMTQSQSRQELANLCIDAAKATIQLVLVLKKHNLLCRFSFTDHQPTTSALIILVLDSILQQCTDTSCIIHDGVKMLRFMAKGGCRGANSDLATIEQLRAFAIVLRERMYHVENAIQGRDCETPTSTKSADAYESWVRWISDKESQDHSAVIDSDPADKPQIEVTESQILESNLNFLDTSYSHDHSMFDPLYLDRQMGFENISNFGFEWDNGRLDMSDVTQLLTGHSHASESS